MQELNKVAARYYDIGDMVFRVMIQARRNTKERLDECRYEYDVLGIVTTVEAHYRLIAA